MRYNAGYNPVDELFGKKNGNITTESNQNTNDIKENIDLPDNNKTIINDYDQTNYEQNMNIDNNDNNDNNFNYGIDNSENKNFNKHKLFLLFGLILFIVIVIVIIIFIIKIREQKEEIKKEVAVLTDSIDIKAVGFQFDEPFDKNKFEYNLEIDTKKVQIKCSRYERVEGCNQVVDLSDKNSYDHIIKYSTLDDKEYIYTIHINKKGTSGPIKIDSVEINETKYTNDENKVIVNAKSENNKKLQYSFDGGNTWQNSNQYETKENEEVNIVIKDEDGNKTEDKIVEIDNIDKIPPTVDIIIKEKTTNKIVLQANAKDEASGIDSYNWNNSGYIKASIYEVTKAGTYTVVVKDKAGNTSSKASITVPDSAFNKESKKESKTYTVKLVGNGANIEKAQLTCSTYELSCTVKLPNITRENGIIIGFAESASATTAKYNVGEEITLTGNKTLYAITAKKVTATFEKNGANSLSYTSKSCNIYNTNTTCTIKTPTIIRSGWTILGYAESATATTEKYKVSSNISISENKKYYAVTSRTLTATFEKNGASTLSYTNKSCNIYNTNTTCTIKTPTITRSGWTILGFAESASATTEKYKVSSNITISENKKYYAVTSRTLTATFEKNGASTLSYTSKSCNIYNTSSSCNVTTPTITRSGWTILGFAESASATTAKYKVSSNITINSNKKYYAITNKKVTVTFDANGGETIEYTSKSCDLYNNKTSCNIRIPIVNKIGYGAYAFDIKGKSTEYGTYIMNKTYSFSSNKDLIANYLENSSHYRKISVYKTLKYDNVIIEIDNTCSNKDTFVSDIKKIYKNLPYLFKNPGKMMISNDSTYLKIRGNTTAGVTSGFDYYPFIDIKCSSKYTTLVHELTHKWDKEYNLQKGNFIAYQSDVKSLFNKCINMSDRPLRDYSYTSEFEFLADSVSYYYAKYIVKDASFANINYPSNIKSVIEKYIAQGI